MAEYYFAAIIAFISVAVPGILIALPFAKRFSLPLPLAIGFGAAAATILLPLLGFLEFLVGIPFSQSFAILNFTVLSLAGAFLCIKEKAFPEIKPVDDAQAFLFANWHWFALLLVMLFAFWLTSMSSQPYLYDFDPYFYLTTTQFIVQDGSIPATDSLAWYPNDYTHRERPLTHYLTAGWYMMMPPPSFDKTVLYNSAAPYPPLMAVLAAFMIFALVSVEWGEKWGIAAATIFAFIPSVITKFAAGTVEQQPWGIFAILFFCAAYAFYLKKGGLQYALLAGLALLGAVLGSKQDVLAILIFSGFLSLQSLRDFLSNKLKDAFVIQNCAIAGCGILGTLLLLPYRSPGFSGAAALLAAAAFSALLLAIVKFEKNTSKRPTYLAAIIILALLAFILTPIGPKMIDYAKSTEFLSQRAAIFSTVLEEAQMTANLPAQLGPIGAQIGLDFPLTILLISALAFTSALLYRNSKIALLLMLLVFPLAWLGFDKGKFIVHLATVLPIAFAALLGEISLYLVAGKKPVKKLEKEEPAHEPMPAPQLTYEMNFEGGEAFEKRDELAAETPKEERKRKRSEPTDYSTYLPLAILAIGAFAVLVQAASTFSDSSASISGGYKTSEGDWNCTNITAEGKQISAYMLCSKIAPDWTGAMGWLSENPSNSSAIAWWDYGHWVNYLGQSKAVVRGDLAFPDMVAEVADIYTQGSPQALASYMRSKNAKYVVFDSGLFQRWQVLAYQSCYKRGLTNATFVPSESNGKPSACEQDLQFEYLFVPIEGRTVNDYCAVNNTQGIRARSSFNRTYCLLEPGIGSSTPNKLDVFFENGTKLDIGQEYVGQSVMGGRLHAILLSTYNENSIQYAPGSAYDSAFYAGMMLRTLPGFSQAYPEGGKSGTVIIFELQ